MVTAWEQGQDMVAHAVTLYHPREDRAVLMFPDASDRALGELFDASAALRDRRLRCRGGHEPRTAGVFQWYFPGIAAAVGYCRRRLCDSQYLSPVGISVTARWYAFGGPLVVMR